MYAQLDVVAVAEDNARAVALQDRMRYRAFLEAGERCAAKRGSGLIVGGAAATRLLLDPPGAPPGLDDFQYDFYGDGGRAQQRARELGDAAFAADPDGLGHYTAVTWKVPGARLAVAVDGRDLFTVTALPVHRGVHTADVVIPSTRPARFARDESGAPLRLRCMPPSVQLMDAYATLCNPGRASAWGATLATEAALRALFLGEAAEQISSAVQARRGGAEAAGGADDAAGPRLGRALREYAASPGRVLVGPVAIGLLAGAPAPPRARLQVVAAAPLEAEETEIRAIAARAGAEVYCTVNDPKIPTDPRLRRMTVHVAVGRDRREPVLDVFNAAGHELVPYASAAAVLAGRGATGGRRSTSRRRPGDGHPGDGRADGAAWATLEQAPAALKIGTPFVLLRLRLADMWTMQVLLRMGAVSAEYARGVLHEMLGDYRAAAAVCDAGLRRAESDPDAAAALLLPASAYVGRGEDADLALKREAQGRFPPPYFPAARRAGEPSRKAKGAAEARVADRDGWADSDDWLGAEPRTWGLAARRAGRPSVAERAPEQPELRWVGDARAACPPLSADEVRKRADALYDRLTAGRAPAPPGKAPHFVLTIGPPGAGKTTVARTLVGLEGGAADYVELDYDALLDFFPEGDAIRSARDMDGRPTGVGHAFGWEACMYVPVPAAVAALARLQEARYNLIVHSHVQVDLIAAQSWGYVCTLLYVAVSPETALRRCAERARTLGRYLEGASAENGWGWADPVNRMWSRYRAHAPWYALWADRFAIVVNDRDGAYPSPEDFRVLDCHPPGVDWRDVLSGFFAAVAKAHGEASPQAPQPD